MSAGQAAALSARLRLSLSLRTSCAVASSPAAATVTADAGAPAGMADMPAVVCPARALPPGPGMGVSRVPPRQAISATVCTDPIRALRAKNRRSLRLCQRDYMMI